MIVMINERNGRKTRFKNYEKLYSHLNSHQWTKRHYRPNRIINDWFFACHSYKRVIAFYEFVLMQRSNAKGGKVPKLDVLEMSDDRFSKPVLIPITPDIDVESLRKDWCKRHCKFHGYELVEIQDNDGILHVKRT